MTQSYDYIIIGAGSAGCVLAARLTENPATRVLLLEAGPPDRSLWIHLPIGYGKTMWSKTLNWCFYTDPDPNMNGRRIYWPRGKTLGGSSAINGLIYIRGQREDFDAWAQAGNTGWGYADVLPYFIRAENNQRGASEYHGGQGPLAVSDIAGRDELIEAFIAGAQETGVPRTEDFNGATQTGAGYYQLTTSKGWRCSTATGYLKPVRMRKNLTVATEAHACAILFDKPGDTQHEKQRAIGVRYRQQGAMQEARCNAEVLLCAGAIASPQLLQLSGVGPANLLRQFEIPLVCDSPGVGENLQDHLQFRLSYECSKPITTNDALNSLLGRAKLGWQWLSSRTGALAVGINQGGCFMRVLPSAAGESNRPDIQFHVATLSADMAGGKVHPYSGFTLSVCQLRPESRGSVHARTTSALDDPAMDPRYLSAETDVKTMLSALRLARQVVRQPALAAYAKAETRPGIDVQSDDEVLAYIKSCGQTSWHPIGTCKMGPASDAASVVDPCLRVRGVSALRVVDSSIMPTMPSSNTNAAAIVIGEKAADLILENTP